MEAVQRASNELPFGVVRGVRDREKSKVLLAGVGCGPFEAVAPVHERQKLDIVQVESLLAAGEMAMAKNVDLIIFDAVVEEAFADLPPV